MSNAVVRRQLGDECNTLPVLLLLLVVVMVADILLVPVAVDATAFSPSLPLSLFVALDFVPLIALPLG